MVGNNLKKEHVLYMHYVCVCVLSRSVISDPLQPHGPLSATPGSSVNRILQARILEWIAIPFFRVSSQCRDQTWASSIADRFFTL